MIRRLVQWMFHSTRWQQSFVRWRRRSLVADSTVRIFFLGMGMALLIALGSTTSIRDHETERLLGHVEDLLSTVESTARVACFVGDATLAQDVAKGLITNELVAGVRITAGQRTLVEMQKGGAVVGPRNDVIRRMIASPFRAEQLVGSVEITVDNHYIQTQAQSFSLMGAVVLVLQVVAVVAVVALVMMRMVVRPIRILSDRTHAIQIHSDEPVLPPEGNENNEIGLLARDFNRLIFAMNRVLATEQSMREEVALSERRFRTLVENSPDIIMRFDRNCRRVFVNPAYTRQTGFPAERVLNTGLDNATIWRPFMPVEEFGRRLREVMASGVPDLILLEWANPDGQVVSHELYVVAEYDAGGKISGALAMGRDVTQRKEVERQLLRLASYDALTGMPNRRMFGDRLREEIARADRHGKTVALLFLDLDRFKDVNDTLGHETGDRLLVEAAQRIRDCVRESDMVARLGGDEFVVIVADVGNAAHLVRIAQDILGRLERPFDLDGHMVRISTSIGIACYPVDAGSQEGLIGCADQAMYAAKEQGRNGFSFFTRDMQAQAQHRLALGNDIHKALDKNQLQVWFQPIIEASTGRVVKAEALLRWKHPLRGMVPPDQFIPIAEEIGAIHDIGDWVFRESARVVKDWRETLQREGGTGEMPSISVNLSPRQFARGNIALSWARYLHDIGLPGEAIVIEITEGLLLRDTNDIMEKLEQFRHAGMRLALDDFGTGYSAMAYLKKFNIDYLKIDRSFIRDLEIDPGDRAIAEAIVAMAHRLGLKVVAEGVETAGQRDLLAAVGCEYLQGYFFAKPMPLGDFLAYIQGQGAIYVEPFHFENLE